MARELAVSDAVVTFGLCDRWWWWADSARELGGVAVEAGAGDGVVTAAAEFSANFLLMEMVVAPLALPTTDRGR